MDLTTTRRVYLHQFDDIYIKEKNTFLKTLSLERERFRLSMHATRDTAEISCIKNTPEQTTDITQYVIFSIDASTFEKDFLDPDDPAIPSVRDILTN